MPEVIKKLKKNSSEEIWVVVTDYKERELLDIRVYYRSIDDMQMKPTKRGVSVPLSKVGEILAALEKIDTMTEIGKPIIKMDKSETEMIQVALKEFKGHKLVDIRTYFLPQTGGEMVPSQKGVAFKYNMLEEIKDAFRKAQAMTK
ncbi:MAG TPA: transcriptional coactivator p15/PC4 family protein [Elusimicrobiota bacterium]|nr:transcriptional coactivator p15/PC4 family protein [Elusimicrobiota bacterium]